MIKLYHYSQADFKRDLKRIYFILPKELKDIKINLITYGNTSFSNGININFLGLSENEDLKIALEFYLHKRLSLRQYIIYCILHEYGHYNRYIQGLNDMRAYREQTYWIDLSNNPYIKRQLDYWRHITEEKEAWKFAKKYINKITLTK
jgi:hypothetical protein